MYHMIESYLDTTIDILRHFRSNVKRKKLKRQDKTMSQFQNGNLCTVTYDAVREAMNGESFPMSLVGENAKIVIDVVNQGIDSHLEACYVPERGDKYGDGKRMAGKMVITRTLECDVSVESMPVLLRRLFEHDDEAAMRLGDDILQSLGFDDCGRFVGRE